MYAASSVSLSMTSSNGVPAAAVMDVPVFRPESIMLMSACVW